ncbi:MAG: paraquat-inducible protein A [Salinisphaeraceae bacterium]|nr:paraquat-inducible protein A [Salinisphaeraceae bacterium]
MAKTIAATHRINALMLILLSMMTWYSWQLIQELRAHQQLAQDLAELRDVKYGLLDANKWVYQVTDIVQQEIQTLDINPENRAQLKKALERILDTLITEADKHVRRQHRKGDWWDRTTGKIKESVRNTLMDVETVKAGIPGYAEEILNELEKPQTRQEISQFLSGMVSDITRETFSPIDDSVRQAIYDRYGCEATSDCKEIIKDEIQAKDESSTQLALMNLLLAVLILLAGSRVAGPDNRLAIVLMSCATLLLLLAGVLTPMIEVEAQIRELKFMLMGHPVEFYNEVFYYQSKSVLDVVSILMAKREYDLMLVGVLIMIFSVVFPALKLICSMFYLYAPGLRSNRMIEFFALKSSKWSMADVMVIAIFMAYIGFSGMVSSQMDLIARGAQSTNVNVLTTEGTSLQIGFFMFLAFCLASLVVSSRLESIIARGDDP